MWSLLRVLSILFLTEFSLSCVPTKSVVHTTVSDVPVPAAVPTTIPCCPILSQTALPKRPPVSADFEQCSILRRVSSSCPTDGYVFCDAAPDTNPTTMQIEFFNGNGTAVRTVQKAGVSLSVRIICQSGIWWVRATPTSNVSVQINQVSCSQTGSAGRDLGYVIGTASD